jgi:hypothetical protein
LGVLNTPNGIIELRAKAKDGMDQRFFRSHSQAATAAFFAGEKTDVYVGVLPRIKNSGGADAITPVARTLWVDCDNEMAVERAMAWGHRAHFAVMSSPGRAHFYWLIRDLPTELVFRANQRLAFMLGGDLRCADPARILRVAGTNNFKRDEPVPCVLAGTADIPEYSTQDLVGDLRDPAPPKVKVPRHGGRKFDDPSKDALLSVRSTEYAERLTGREVNRAGMLQCPFHKGGQERTPSLHVGGPHDTLWFCHGCGDGGDIFTMAEKLWGVSEFPVLVKRLQEIF